MYPAVLYRVWTKARLIEQRSMRLALLHSGSGGEGQRQLDGICDAGDGRHIWDGDVEVFIVHRRLCLSFECRGIHQCDLRRKCDGTCDLVNGEVTSHLEGDC